MRQKSILFVCTGNVFRSVSAEYSLKKYLSEHNISDWKVSSAGIVAKKEPIDYKTLEVLKELGIKNIRHKQKKLTKDMVNEYDIVIAMAENHLNFIRSKLKYPKAILFNELAIGKKNSIWDIEDDVKDYKTDRQAVEKKIEKTVKEIRKKIPKLFKNLDG
jgi:protein-tyrosine phosphatase